MPRSVASLPDPGSLAVVDPSRRTVRRRTYTWYPIQLSEEHALRAIVDGEMEVRSPGGQVMRLRYVRHIEHPDGNWTWIGRPPGAAPGVEAIITFGAKAVFGTIPQETGQPWRVTTEAGGTWMLEPDNSAVAATEPPKPDFIIPPEFDTALSPRVAAAQPTTSTGPTLAQAGTSVDLLIGYTGAFAVRLGGQSAAVTRLTYIVDVANQSYANSQIDATIRLVRTAQVTYPDATSNQSALYDLTGVQCTDTGGGLDCEFVGSPASLQPLHALRDQHGADLVALVRNFSDPENDGCGIAWLNGGGQSVITAADEATGFSVISDSNGTGPGAYDDNGFVCRDETLAHELGHNMGSAHDLDTANGDDNVLQSHEYGRFPYSFGYKTGNFYTIMAYGDNGQTPYRVFSNPAIISCGGSPCGVAGQADNARSLRETMPIIATFRAAVVDVPIPQLRSVDIDGNAKSDLFFFNHALGRFANWFMSGTARVATSSGALPGGARVVDSGDFNGDGRSDLLLTNDARNVLIAISNGYGFSLQQMSVNVAAGYELLGVADVNGNGKSDILLRHSTSGELVVWYMAGATLAAYNKHATNPAFVFAGTGDFNGDGRQDVLWTNARQLVIGFSNGTTFSLLSTGLTHDSAYALRGVQDIDGNRRSDIVLYKTSNNHLVIWYMNGAARVSYNSTTIPSTYRLIGKGDFDANRKGDLLLRHPTTGAVAIMFSSGVALAPAYVPYASDLAWHLMDVEL